MQVKEIVDYFSPYVTVLSKNNSYIVRNGIVNLHIFISKMIEIQAEEIINPIPNRRLYRFKDYMVFDYYRGTLKYIEYTSKYSARKSPLNYNIGQLLECRRKKYKVVNMYLPGIYSLPVVEVVQYNLWHNIANKTLLTLNRHELEGNNYTYNTFKLYTRKKYEFFALDRIALNGREYHIIHMLGKSKALLEETKGKGIKNYVYDLSGAILKGDF